MTSQLRTTLTNAECYCSNGVVCFVVEDEFVSSVLLDGPLAMQFVGFRVRDDVRKTFDVTDYYF